MSSERDSTSLGKLTAITIGGLVVGVLVLAATKEFGILDASIVKRAVGMVFGTMLIVAGNILPKITQPLNSQRRNAVSIRMVERIAGWIFVVTGIAYISVWLFAPGEYAMLISSIVGLSAFVLVATIWAWLTLREQSTDQY